MDRTKKREMPFVVKGLSSGSSVGDKRVVSRMTDVTAIIDFSWFNFYSKTRRCFSPCTHSPYSSVLFASACLSDALGSAILVPLFVRPCPSLWSKQQSTPTEGSACCIQCRFQGLPGTTWVGAWPPNPGSSGGEPPQPSP